MKTMSFGQLGLDRQHELRKDAIQWVRRWQEQFPPDDDGDLDLSERAHNKPAGATDRLVRSFVVLIALFAIRVRPDNVVGVGNKLVAWEWSTAKSAQAISPARFVLNHHALLRERLRRPDWEKFTSISTRVEMLALGVGFTVSLHNEEAETWRIVIGKVAEDLLVGVHEPNRGPLCSICPWQTSCWFISTSKRRMNGAAGRPATQATAAGAPTRPT